MGGDMGKTSHDLRQMNKKRWTIFGVALLLPILLVLLLFVAASQDAKMKKQYDAQRESYAEKNYSKTESKQLIASDPEASTSSNKP